MQTSSLLYKSIENHQYADASRILKDCKKPKDLNEVFDLYEGKNCLQLVMNQPSNQETNNLVNEMIQAAEKCNGISKFKESSPFKHALDSEDEGHFNNLLNRIDLLDDKEIPKCLDMIVKKSLTNKCEQFLTKLNEKQLRQITFFDEETNTCPLFQSITENKISIFGSFLSHLTRIKQGENQETYVFQTKNKDKNTVLHAISRNPDGPSFLRTLLNTKILDSRIQKETKETLFNEAIYHINTKNSNDETPFFTACRNGNAKIAKELLQYGADLPISINEEDKPNEDVIKLLKKAKYGLISPADELSEDSKKPIEERKKQGFLKCCKDGKIEYAKKLVKTHKVDPSINDTDSNSPAMIMVNNGVAEEDIIKFIQFLVRKKKINFNHINKNKDNLLTLSLSNNKEQIALHLIENYAANVDLNQKNSKNFTALTLATSKEFSKVIRALSKFSKQIDLNKHEQGWTALNCLNKRPTTKTQLQQEKKNPEMKVLSPTIIPQIKTPMRTPTPLPKYLPASYFTKKKYK